jgi:hypothetical protein
MRSGIIPERNSISTLPRKLSRCSSHGGKVDSTLQLCLGPYLRPMCFTFMRIHSYPNAVFCLAQSIWTTMLSLILRYFTAPLAYPLSNISTVQPFVDPVDCYPFLCVCCTHIHNCCYALSIYLGEKCKSIASVWASHVCLIIDLMLWVDNNVARHCVRVSRRTSRLRPSGAQVGIRLEGMGPLAADRSRQRRVADVDTACYDSRERLLLEVRIGQVVRVVCRTVWNKGFHLKRSHRNCNISGKIDKS